VILRALAAVAMLATASPAAPAQPAPTGRLALASQTPWVGPGGELAIRITATSTAEPADVELAVSLYRQVGSRSEFLNTLKDRLRGAPLTATATPLTELTPDAAGALTVVLPVQDPDQPPDRNRLRLKDEGVYPVRVELREAGGGRTLDRFVTHLVYAAPPKEGGLPLGFAWVVPIGAPPTLKPDGSRRVAPLTSNRVGALAQGLDAHPDVALTLQPVPETLAALEASTKEVDRSTMETLARIAGSTGRQVLGGTYVPVQPGAFAGNGGEAEFAAQLDRAGDVINGTLSVRPDSRTWVSDERLDEAALDRLRTQQVDRIVLPDTALTASGLPVTLAQPFELQSRSLRRPTAAATDPELNGHFVPPGGSDRPDDPVLRAHALLADLAVLYFDRPGKARAVVAQSPRSWAAERPFLDAVLAGLSASPIIKGVTLDQVFSNVPMATTTRTTPLTRRLADATDTPTLPLSAIRQTRDRLDAFGSMLDGDNAIDDELEEVLLTAQSSDLRSSRQRTLYLNGVGRRIDDELKHLAVPPNRTITLTARRGEIPVTIQWTGDYAIHIRVRVEGDKLTFPGGGTVRSLDLSRRNTTERFEVEARTSGDFPLRISLESPQGSLTLARTRFTVRSTAASGVGIALSVGAGAILLTWWARHLARGRRNRRLVPA
jgi:hypothetical protein